MIHAPPRSPPTAHLFPYTALFRSLDVADEVESTAPVAVPEEVPNSLESGDGHVFIRLGWGRQSARDLLHDRHPHGDVEIVEDMLGVRPHVPLKIADVPATIGHEGDRSEEHTSELQSLMRNSYAVFCLKKK